MINFRNEIKVHCRNQITEKSRVLLPVSCEPGSGFQEVKQLLPQFLVNFQL
jgi:hypothetical protein